LGHAAFAHSLFSGSENAVTTKIRAAFSIHVLAAIIKKLAVSVSVCRPGAFNRRTSFADRQPKG
jgi:hypothetical protein